VLFHWHVADLGMELSTSNHVLLNSTARSRGRIKPTRRSSINFTDRDEVDLGKKLAAWEGFYNYDRPHGAHSGKTPYEVLREKLR
jgi:hypothetical protein